MRKRLPRSPRHIASTEFASEFIEVFPRLILPLLEHKLPICAIARAFAQFARQESSDFRHTLALRALPIVVRAVINIFSDTAISHHASPFQLSQMARNTRLAHPKNLLQFSDRKFLLFEKKQQPQPCRIGKQSQQING